MMKCNKVFVYNNIFIKQKLYKKCDTNEKNIARSENKIFHVKYC